MYTIEVQLSTKLKAYIQSLEIKSDKNMYRNTYQFNNKPVNKQNKRKKEVVFLPYKASMWDSLELVWKKAEKDKNTNAVVIPIPYYDKNPDGSFGELHYEADKFPPDVPIVRYDEYDFATKHPDVIYIHNPYDEGNFVTSVHPFFYSKNLKNYTDELVYIPYFVLNDPDPENENDLKGIENYVMVPAVINATRVIVQSGQMKKAYVEILTRNTRPDMRQFWEKRIEGTGSPKIERVKNLRKEDFLLPKEWERLIYRESPVGDGSTCEKTGIENGQNKKKIIFYNTSISALLKKR